MSSWQVILGEGAVITAAALLRKSKTQVHSLAPPPPPPSLLYLYLQYTHLEPLLRRAVQPAARVSTVSLSASDLWRSLPSLLVLKSHVQWILTLMILFYLPVSHLLRFSSLPLLMFLCSTSFIHTCILAGLCAVKCSNCSTEDLTQTEDERSKLREDSKGQKLFVHETWILRWQCEGHKEKKE